MAASDYGTLLNAELPCGPPLRFQKPWDGLPNPHYLSRKRARSADCRVLASAARRSN